MRAGGTARIVLFVVLGQVRRLRQRVAGISPVGVRQAAGCCATCYCFCDACGCGRGWCRRNNISDYNQHRCVPCAAIASRGRPARHVTLLDQATYEKKVSRFWTGLSEELGAEFGTASAFVAAVWRPHPLQASLIICSSLSNPHLITCLKT